MPKGVEEGRNLVDSEVSYAILCLYFDYELLILLLVELFGLVSCVFHRYDIWLDSNGTLLEWKDFGEFFDPPFNHLITTNRRSLSTTLLFFS